MDGGGRGRAGLRWTLRAGATVLLMAVLTGCAGWSERTVTSALVNPGKYEFHSCEAIKSSIRTQRARQSELEQLMAKSAQSFGGEFVNAIAYRSEHLRTRGEIDVLVKTAEDKQCITQSPWSSERALF
jgi:hypothetical protein